LLLSETTVSAMRNTPVWQTRWESAVCRVELLCEWRHGLAVAESADSRDAGSLSALRHFDRRCRVGAELWEERRAVLGSNTYSLGL
jgi:hypothetical protein